jgi:transcription elongation GreA/GreB family factor
MALTPDVVNAACIALLEEKIAGLQLQLDELKTGLSADSKSTSGDKHETSRAMAHIEQEHLAGQMAVLRAQLLSVHKLRSVASGPAIAAGSLVTTNHGIFYLCVALGRITADGNEVMVLSAQSPLGQVFLGKHTGDTFTFGGRSYVVTAPLI